MYKKELIEIQKRIDIYINMEFNFSNCKEILIPININDLSELFEDADINQLVFSYIHSLIDIIEKFGLDAVYPINLELIKKVSMYQTENKISTKYGWGYTNTYKDVSDCVYAYFYNENYKFENEDLFESIGSIVFNLRERFKPITICIFLEGSKKFVIDYIKIMGENFYRLYWKYLYKGILRKDLDVSSSTIPIRNTFNELYAHCFIYPVLEMNEIEELLRTFCNMGYYNEDYIKFLNEHNSLYADGYLADIVMKELNNDGYK